MARLSLFINWLIIPSSLKVFLTAHISWNILIALSALLDPEFFKYGAQNLTQYMSRGIIRVECHIKDFISSLLFNRAPILYSTMIFGVNAIGNKTRPMAPYLQSFCLAHFLSCVWKTEPLIEALQLAISFFQSFLFHVIPPIGRDYPAHFQSAQGLSLKLITTCRCNKCTLYFIICDINKKCHKIAPDSG